MSTPPQSTTGDGKEGATTPGRSPTRSPIKHISLTTHPFQFGIKPIPINWEAWEHPQQRGPVVGTLTNPKIKNAIGTHQGEYAIYRAVAIAQGAMKPDWKPDFTNTTPNIKFGPYPSWAKIVSFDPWGHEVVKIFSNYYEQGVDIRPSIAVTKAHIQIPELRDAVKAGRLIPDGEIMMPSGDIRVTKAALDPVWYLPAIAKRLNVEEHNLRRTIFEQTGGMFPELITRYDLSVFLPPIGGVTCYIFGDPAAITDPNKKLAVRVHDECNGSDVFGSDICTCRPYLVHGVEVCIQTAQEGGAGVIVYNRKEGRALGEVVKYLVYNARKRQEGGDSAATYFERTKCVAGVEDARVQPLMPDALHWLGITKIDKFVSMSNDKYDAVTGGGIEIVERIAIPEELIPPDAHVEINAKVAHGYFTKGDVPDAEQLQHVQGRTYQ